MTKINKKGTMVAVSGYFNPLHAGHLRMLEEAKKLGDFLIVIVNSDAQVKVKGSVPFMEEEERMMIVRALKTVDEVVLSIDKDATVCKTLAKIKPDIFANGGDRASSKDIPEAVVCRRLDIKMIFNVGGNKTNSSSSLIKNAAENHLQKLADSNTVSRPWGHYTVLLTGPTYKAKKFVVNPGQSLSLQSHKHRSEHWVVVAGQARVERGQENLLLKKNETVFIPVNTKHRVANPSLGLLEIVEVQHGDYLGEDDIVRFNDEYGRARISK